MTQPVFQSCQWTTFGYYYDFREYFPSSNIGAIIFNCGPLFMDASLVLEDFFGRSRISSIIKGLNSRSLQSSFRWSTKRNFSEGLALSIGPFQKVQHEAIYFPYVVRKNAALTFSTRPNFMVPGPLRVTILGILGRLQKMQ